jgi:sensor histidine kinase YesM
MIEISIITTINIWGNETKMIYNTAAEYFDSTQSNFTKAIAQINNYYLTMYSNKPLVQDLTYFMGNTPQSYLSNRLTSNGPEETVSILDNLKDFVSSNNYDIDQIHCISNGNVSTISYDDSGTSYSFHKGTLADIQNMSSILEGVIFSKNVLSYNQVGNPIGEIAFRINTKNAFTPNLPELINYCVLVDDSNLSVLKDTYNLSSSDGLNNIYESSKTSGNIRFGTLNNMKYWVFVSSEYNYKLVIGTDTYSILERVYPKLIVIEFLLALICVIPLIIYGKILGQNSEKLNRILKVMRHTPNGNFERINCDGLKSEYYLIACSYNNMVTSLEEHIQTEYLYLIKQQETQMKELQTQINPHFLYNTLEIIRSRSLLSNDITTADAIQSLGQLYREFTRLENNITMEQEINLLRSYLNLMSIKYEDNFCYQIDMDEETMKLDTVKFWMQPLAENFFKYGYINNREMNLLIITGIYDSDQYIITIEDNGSGMEKDEIESINTNIERVQSINIDTQKTETLNKEKIGVLNVAQRLKYFYHSHVTMYYKTNEMEGLSIIIEIAKQEGNDVQNTDC